MKIYGIPGCPFVNRVQIGVAVRGLAARFPLEIVDLAKPPASMLRINPLGSVPTLEVATGDGFNESLAILLYLDSVDAPGPHLFGSPQATGKIQALIELVGTRFLSAVQAIIYARGSVPKRRAALARLPDAIAAMGNILEEHAPHGLFGGAANPNAVDCAVAPFLARLALLNEMLPDVPPLPADSRAGRYAERLLAHDAVRNALPDAAILKQALIGFAFPSPDVEAIRSASRNLLDEDSRKAAALPLAGAVQHEGIAFSGWRLEHDAKGPLLRASYRFPTPRRALDALEALHDMQDTADHHAASKLQDIATLELEICTHEPKWGLSGKDIALAHAITQHPAFR